MAKQKVVFALSATAVALGASVFGLAGQAFAYTEDTDGYAITVGDTDAERYEDLKQAIADGKNVRLGDNISHYVTVSGAPSITIDHTMNLDLNGFTLSTASTSGGTNGNTGIAATGEGTVLTIQDSKGGGEIRYDHKGNAAPNTLRIEAGAKVVLTGGGLSTPYGRSGEGIGVNIKGAGATFEMTGGTIHSHEESTSSSSYGVRFNSAGSLTVSGGEISTYGSAIAVPNSNAAVVNISGNPTLASTGGQAIEISSANTSGTISGVTVKDMTMAGTVGLSSANVTGNLTVKGGEKTISDVTVSGNCTISGGPTTITNTIVNGMTTITGGVNTLGNGANMAGGVTYQSAATASLIITDGATVNGFTQAGKTTNVSYTDKDTMEKVSYSYDSYGVLNITGGTFNGEFTAATAAQVESSNATRKEYVDAYNEHSGKTPLVYSDVASVPEISGGVFAEEPNADDIQEGKSVYRTQEGYVVVDDAELAKENLEYADDDEDGYYELMPIKIDWNEDLAVADLGDGRSIAIEFRSELIADRLATLNVGEKSADSLTLTGDGVLYEGFEIDFVDRDGVKIDVRNTEMLLYITLSEDDYNKLAEYDKIELVYFNEDGVEAERIEAELMADGGLYWILAHPTHLSAYGVVGVNETSEEEGGTSTNTDGATPDTGSMTREGGSAIVAAIVTSIAVGLLVSCTSFVYLIRRI